MKDIQIQRPNERDCSELESSWARTIALPSFYSPYVKAGSTNWLQNGINRFFNNRSSLDDALKYIQDRYNQEIEISKNANPAMMEAWKKGAGPSGKDRRLQEGRKEDPRRMDQESFLCQVLS